jgi:hypothetical protein
MKKLENRFKAYMAALIGGLLIFFLASCGTNAELSSDTEYGGNRLPGNWIGKQKISVRYTTGFMDYTFVKSQDSVLTELYIEENGKVTGKVGNAEFKEAKVKKNRGSLGRKLNLATDYVIRGQLNGSTFEGDSIREKEISIPLYFENGKLKGDLFMNKGLGLYPMGSLELLKRDSF